MSLRCYFVMAAALAVGLPSVLSGQRIADPNFNTTVTKPAYANQGPRVLFDEAHHNIHTASRLYKPLADLLTADGYRITPNADGFTSRLLQRFDILVISNALGATASLRKHRIRPSRRKHRTLLSQLRKPTR